MSELSQDLFNLDNKRLFKDPLPVRMETGDGARESTLAKLANQAGGAPASGIGDGSFTVTSAGTAVQVHSGSLAIVAVAITALSGNSGVLWIGGSTVADGRGLPLAAGETTVLGIDNLNKVYADTDNSTDGGSFLYLSR